MKRELLFFNLLLILTLCLKLQYIQDEWLGHFMDLQQNTTSRHHVEARFRFRRVEELKGAVC